MVLHFEAIVFEKKKNIWSWKLPAWNTLEISIPTVGTESIRTAERISRENAFFKTLPKIEFSVEFNTFFFEG
jgi:hypothetical protein